MTIKENNKTFPDVAGDTLEMSLFGGEGLYLRATGTDGDNGEHEIYLRFSQAESLRIRQHMLDLFPLEVIASEPEVGVLAEAVFNPSPSITININSLTVNA